MFKSKLVCYLVCRAEGGVIFLWNIVMYLQVHIQPRKSKIFTVRTLNLAKFQRSFEPEEGRSKVIWNLCNTKKTAMNMKLHYLCCYSVPKQCIVFSVPTFWTTFRLISFISILSQKALSLTRKCCFGVPFMHQIQKKRVVNISP